MNFHATDIIFCLNTSGESGSGKTENSKVIMRYISSINAHMEEIERVKNLLIMSSPVLESFGNAQTIRNDNSSRFVRRMIIQCGMFGGDTLPIFLFTGQIHGHQL